MANEVSQNIGPAPEMPFDQGEVKARAAGRVNKGLPERMPEERLRDIHKILSTRDLVLNKSQTLAGIKLAKQGKIQGVFNRMTGTLQGSPDLKKKVADFYQSRLGSQELFENWKGDVDGFLRDFERMLSFETEKLTEGTPEAGAVSRIISLSETLRTQMLPIDESLLRATTYLEKQTIIDYLQDLKQNNQYDKEELDGAIEFFKLGAENYLDAPQVSNALRHYGLEHLMTTFEESAYISGKNLLEGTPKEVQMSMISLLESADAIHVEQDFNKGEREQARAQLVDAAMGDLGIKSIKSKGEADEKQLAEEQLGRDLKRDIAVLRFGKAARPRDYMREIDRRQQLASPQELPQLAESVQRNVLSDLLLCSSNPPDRAQYRMSKSGEVTNTEISRAFLPEFVRDGDMVFASLQSPLSDHPATETPLNTELIGKLNVENFRSEFDGLKADEPAYKQRVSKFKDLQNKIGLLDKPQTEQAYKKLSQLCQDFKMPITLNQPYNDFVRGFEQVVKDNKGATEKLNLLKTDGTYKELYEIYQKCQFFQLQPTYEMFKNQSVPVMEREIDFLKKESQTKIHPKAYEQMITRMELAKEYGKVKQPTITGLREKLYPQLKLFFEVQSRLKKQPVDPRGRGMPLNVIIDEADIQKVISPQELKEMRAILQELKKEAVDASELPLIVG